MSDVDKRQQSSVNTGIRNDPLHDYEKKELTHYLRDLSLAPKQGRVILHFNNGFVCKVEPQPVL